MRGRGASGALLAGLATVALGAADPLRTGAYGTTLTFTLSTTAP